MVELHGSRYGIRLHSPAYERIYMPSRVAGTGGYHEYIRYLGGRGYGGGVAWCLHPQLKARRVWVGTSHWTFPTVVLLYGKGESETLTILVIYQLGIRSNMLQSMCHLRRFRWLCRICTGWQPGLLSGMSASYDKTRMCFMHWLARNI